MALTPSTMLPLSTKAPDFTLPDEDLRSALGALLAGHDPPDEQRPSMGCNIKWNQGNEPDYFG
jgi:hypothetical protein